MRSCFARTPLALIALATVAVPATAQIYLSDYLGQPSGQCYATTSNPPFTNLIAHEHGIGVDTQGSFDCGTPNFLDGAGNSILLSKALGAHPTNGASGTRIEFDLDALRQANSIDFCAFEAQVGIDLRGNFGARFTVHVDGVQRASVDIADRFSPAQWVRVDLQGSSRLRLTTTWLGQFGGNHALWGYPRLVSSEWRDSVTCSPSNWEPRQGYGMGVPSNQQYRTAPNSLSFRGDEKNYLDLAGFNDGQWTFRTWMYVDGSSPLGDRGNLYLLNEQWQLPNPFTAAFALGWNTTTMTLEGAPLLLDQWVEIRLEIDLDNNEVLAFYDDRLVRSGPYLSGSSGSQQRRIAALMISTVERFAIGTRLYFDEFSLVRSFNYREWSDDFDRDPTGTPMCNRRGWHGLNADPGEAAITNDIAGRNGSPCLETRGTSAVRPFSGIDRGHWTLKTWHRHVGPRDSLITVFNTYQHGGPNHEAVRLILDTTSGFVYDVDRPETPRPIVQGQYVEIRIEIDLERGIMNSYYNGQKVSGGSYAIQGGPYAIAGVNVLSRDLSYWDDFSLEPTIPLLQTVDRHANGHRYHLLPPSSWHEAQEAARQLGGNLVSVTSQEDQDFLYDTFGRTRHLWTGLNDLAQEGTFRWVDGATTSYRNWAPGEPNAVDPGEHFVHITKQSSAPGTPNSGLWNDMASQGNAWSGSIHGVVEVRSDGVLQQAVNPANGNRYLMLTVDSWTDARARALALGGDLVTINDLQEYDWVISTFGALEGWRRRLWTGLNDIQNEGSFVWASGQTGFVKWVPGSPANRGDHVLIDPNSSNWGMREASANDNSAFGIVEIENTSIEASIFNPANGHYYHRIVPNSWTGAEAVARDMGGHLASVSDRAEHDFIVQNLGGQNRYLYLGLTDERVEGIWEWTSGEPVNFTLWATNPQEPNGGTAENYVTADPTRANYAWVDRNNNGAGFGIVEIIPIHMGHGRNCNDADGVGLDLSYQGVARLGGTTEIQLTSNWRLSGNATLYLSPQNQNWLGIPLPYTTGESWTGCAFYLPFDLPTYTIGLGDKNSIQSNIPNEPTIVGAYAFFQTWALDLRIQGPLPLAMSDYLWVYFRP